MPQIVTSQSNPRTPYGVFGSAYAPNFGEVRKERKLDRDRTDAALNKAVQALQTMKAPLGSEITINDGVVNSNNALQDSMKPKTQDKSKTGRTGLRMDLVKSAADKTIEGMRTFGALQGDRTAFDDVKEQARVAAAKQARASINAGSLLGNLNEGEGNGLGGSSGSGINASKSASTSMGKSMSLGERSVTMPEDDYITSGQFQQGFDDSFKRDTEGAWKQALMNDIIGTASGQGYDPSKDVYLKQANDRDAAYNDTLKNEMTTNSSLTKYERDGTMQIGGGNENVQYNENDQKGETLGGTKNKSDGGLGNQDDKDKFVIGQVRGGNKDPNKANMQVRLKPGIDPSTGEKTHLTVEPIDYRDPADQLSDSELEERRRQGTWGDSKNFIAYYENRMQPFNNQGFQLVKDPNTGGLTVMDKNKGILGWWVYDEGINGFYPHVEPGTSVTDAKRFFGIDLNVSSDLKTQ